MFIKKIVDYEKKQARRRFKTGLIMNCVMLGAGFFLGVHRNVIKAYIKGEALPESPHKHC